MITQQQAKEIIQEKYPGATVTVSGGNGKWACSVRKTKIVDGREIPTMIGAPGYLIDQETGEVEAVRIR